MQKFLPGALILHVWLQLGAHDIKVNGINPCTDLHFSWVYLNDKVNWELKFLSYDTNGLSNARGSVQFLSIKGKMDC